MLFLGFLLLCPVLGCELLQPPDERGAGGQALEQGIHEAGVAQVQEARDEPCKENSKGLHHKIQGKKHPGFSAGTLREAL